MDIPHDETSEDEPDAAPPSLPGKYLERRRSSLTIIARQNQQAFFVPIPETEKDDKEEESLPAPATVQDLISEIGIGPFHFISVALLACFPLSEGGEMLVISTLATALQQEWQLSAVQTGSLASIAFVGMAIGTYACGFFADVYGRRVAILVSYAGMAGAGLITPMATGYWIMAALRFFNGICCGIGIPAATAMLAEISPVKWRPVLFCSIQACMTVGELYVCLGMMFWMPDLADPTHWRAVSTWAAIPPTLALIVSVFFMQESAHWLIAVGNAREGIIVLQQMARLNGRPEVMDGIGTSFFDAAAIPDQDQAAETNRSGMAELIRATLCNPNQRFKILLFGILAIVCNLTTFGMEYFWPVLLEKQTTKGGVEFGSPAGELFVVRASGLVSSLIALMIVPLRALGHRYAIGIFGPIGAGALCAVIYFRGSEPSGAVLLSCAVASISGVLLDTVMLIFASESFPTQIRSTAIGLIEVLGRIGAICAPLVIKGEGEDVFLAICVCAFASSNFVVLFLKETKGQALSDFTEVEDVSLERQISGVQKAIRSMSKEEIQPIQGSDPDQIFLAGTLAAMRETLLLVTGLGVISTVSTSSFLCSIGIFLDKFETNDLLAVQLLVVNYAVAPCLLIRLNVGSRLLAHDRGVLATIITGLAYCCFVLAFTPILFALAGSRNTLLFFGALAGLFGAIVYTGALELASAIDAFAIVWLHAGAAIGAMLPVPVARMLKYLPDAEYIASPVKFAYFSTASVVSLFLGIFYWRYGSRLSDAQLSNNQETHPESASSSERFIPRHSLAEGTELGQAFRSLEAVLRSNSVSEIELAPAQGPLSTKIVMWIAALNNFFLMGSGSILVSLIPSFASHQDTQFLYFYKLAGDVIGRSSATITCLARDHLSTSSGYAPIIHVWNWNWIGLSMTLFTALTFTLAVGSYMLAFMNPAPVESVSNGFYWCVFGLAAGASVAGSCLDSFVACTATSSKRMRISGWHVLIGFLGVYVGIVTALLYFPHLESRLPVPKSSLLNTMRAPIRNKGGLARPQENTEALARTQDVKTSRRHWNSIVQKQVNMGRRKRTNVALIRRELENDDGELFANRPT